MISIKVGQYWEFRPVVSTDWNEISIIRINKILDNTFDAVYVKCYNRNYIGTITSLKINPNNYSNWRCIKQPIGLHCNDCYHFYNEAKENYYLSNDLFKKFICYECEIKDYDRS